MTEKKKGFYYGWVVVIATFLTQFVTTGLLIYTFSLFVVPMSTMFDVPRTSITIASSIYTIMFAVVSPIVGTQIAKGRIKPLLFASAVLFGGGFLAMSFVNNIVAFYIVYALIGLGGALGGPVVGGALPAAWFDKRKGLAVGIVNCGGGIAAILVAPIIANVMTGMGTQTAFIVIGIIAIVLLVVAAILIKSKPQDIGLMPDGLTKEEYEALPVKERPVVVGLTRSQALKTPTLWMIAVALMFLGFGQLGVMQNAAAYLTDLQFDPQITATALGCIGMAGVAGKLFFGWLVDRMDAKVVFCIGNILLIVGTLFLTYTTQGSTLVWLLGYALLFGFGVGCWTPCITVLLGRMMGMAYFGAIWGVVFALRTVGDILGVPGVSTIAGATGYTTAFWIAIGMLVVSLVLVLVSKKPKAYEDLEKAAAEK